MTKKSQHNKPRSKKIRPGLHAVKNDRIVSKRTPRTKRTRPVRNKTERVSITERLLNKEDFWRGYKPGTEVIYKKVRTYTSRTKGKRINRRYSNKHYYTFRINVKYGRGKKLNKHFEFYHVGKDFTEKELRAKIWEKIALYEAIKTISTKKFLGFQKNGKFIKFNLNYKVDKLKYVKAIRDQELERDDLNPEDLAQDLEENMEYIEADYMDLPGFN